MNAFVKKLTKKTFVGIGNMEDNSHAYSVWGTLVKIRSFAILNIKNTFSECAILACCNAFCSRFPGFVINDFR